MGFYHLSGIPVTRDHYRSTPPEMVTNKAGRSAPLAWNRDVHGLSAPERHNCTGCPAHWWALAPPSHPYLAIGGRLFSSALLYPHEYLPFRKQGALRCPDFPPQRKHRGDRTVYLFRCKGKGSFSDSKDNYRKRVFNVVAGFWFLVTGGWLLDSGF